MAGYRRFVAYVYEYQKGKKAGNCGFIKVEQREERCTLEVHLQCPGLTPNTECRIYGFIRRAGLIEGILLGNCRTQDGRVENTIQTDPQNMGNSGISLKELGGMILRTENGAFFGTEWDDEAIRPENFRELPEERRDVVLPAADNDMEKSVPVPETDTEQSVKYQTGNNEERKMPEDAESYESGEQGEVDEEELPAADVEKSSMDEAAREEKILENPEGETPGFKDTASKEIKGAEEEKPELEISETQTLERQPVQRTVVPGRGFYMQMPGNTSRPLQSGRGENPPHPGMNQRPPQSGPDQKNPPQSGSGQKPMQCERNQRPIQPVSGQNPPLSGRMQFPVDQGTGQTLLHTETEPCPSHMNTKQNCAPIAGINQQKRTDGQPPAQPRQHSQGGNNGKGQFWIGEPCELFDDGEIVGCWKIQPKDFSHFNRRDWALRNNRFLLYGYYNFGHVLLGQKADGTYILGVPGGYDQQERFMANMFGFPCFKESRSIRLQRGKGGYWYRSINPPDFR